MYVTVVGRHQRDITSQARSAHKMETDPVRIKPREASPPYRRLHVRRPRSLKRCACCCCPRNVMQQTLSTSIFAQRGFSRFCVLWEVIGAYAPVDIRAQTCKGAGWLSCKVRVQQMGNLRNRLRTIEHFCYLEQIRECTK